MLKYQYINSISIHSYTDPMDGQWVRDGYTIIRRATKW